MLLASAGSFNFTHIGSLTSLGGFPRTMTFFCLAFDSPFSSCESSSSSFYAMGIKWLQTIISYTYIKGHFEIIIDMSDERILSVVLHDFVFNVVLACTVCAILNSCLKDTSWNFLWLRWLNSFLRTFTCCSSHIQNQLFLLI